MSTQPQKGNRPSQAGHGPRPVAGDRSSFVDATRCSVPTAVLPLLDPEVACSVSVKPPADSRGATSGEGWGIGHTALRQAPASTSGSSTAITRPCRTGRGSTVLVSRRIAHPTPSVGGGVGEETARRAGSMERAYPARERKPPPMIAADAARRSLPGRSAGPRRRSSRPALVGRGRSPWRWRQRPRASRSGSGR